MMSICVQNVRVCSVYEDKLYNDAQHTHTFRQMEFKVQRNILTNFFWSLHFYNDIPFSVGKQHTNKSSSVSSAFMTTPYLFSDKLFFKPSTSRRTQIYSNMPSLLPPGVEHVHHPVGEGVHLVGVVPKDDPPHPLLVLTVAVSMSLT